MTDRKERQRNNPADTSSFNFIFCVFLSAFLFLGSGCAIITPISRKVPKAKSQTSLSEITDDGYKDFTGVIHIHTQYSDGGGTYEDVARIANQQKLDYIVVSDHDTLKPLQDGKQGWYGMTLVLVGDEISTPSGHYLALNIKQEVDKSQSAQKIIDEVKRQGGIGFIAHPYFKKQPWTDWKARGFTGIEGYNTVHDAFDENKLQIGFWGIAVPADPLFLSFINRPDRSLSKWDALISKGEKVVGIGSADAHEVRIGTIKIAPYEIMFKLVRTHVLIPSEKSLSEEEFYRSLSKGHAYFSVDLLTDASGFAFMANDKKQVLGIMGDEVAFSADLELTVSLPSPGQVKLLKDGKEILASTIPDVWHIPILEPGNYRVEAYRHDKPWIFSNPIYVSSRNIQGPSH